MVLNSILDYILIWVLISIVFCAILIFLDYRDGVDIDIHLVDMFTTIPFVILLGPLLILPYIIEEHGDKKLFTIKGKK